MSEEELLLKRIKVIGDGEFTLLGTPDELIKELHSYTQEKCREARIDEARYIDEHIIGSPRKVTVNNDMKMRIAELSQTLKEHKEK